MGVDAQSSSTAPACDQNCRTPSPSCLRLVHASSASGSVPPSRRSHQVADSNVASTPTTCSMSLAAITAAAAITLIPGGLLGNRWPPTPRETSGPGSNPRSVGASRYSTPSLSHAIAWYSRGSSLALRMDS